MVTLNSQLFSQFCIYSRIICNLPLPDLNVYFPSVSHAIILNKNTHNPIFKLDNINKILNNSDVNIRLFGKNSIESRRRMGLLLLKTNCIETGIDLLKKYIHILIYN